MSLPRRLAQVYRRAFRGTLVTRFGRLLAALVAVLRRMPARGVATFRRIPGRAALGRRASRLHALVAWPARRALELGAGVLSFVLRGAEAVRATIAAGFAAARAVVTAHARVVVSVGLLGLGLLLAAAGTKALVSIATAACLVTGAWLAWRRLAAGEERESIDLDEMFTAGLGWVGGDDDTGDGPTWSASAEAGCAVQSVDEEPVEVLDLTAVVVHDERDRSEVEAAAGEWCPTRPLPGEPDEPVAMPSFAGRSGELPITGYVPDAYTTLLERRDSVAVQVAEAYSDLHRMRTEALRRAAQAEHNAELATSARNRAARIVRDTRRQAVQGRERPEEFPDPDDAFDDVHRFRTEALRQAAQAEHGAESVARARERASRLLAEQRKIEAELRKIAPRRFVG